MVQIQKKAMENRRISLQQLIKDGEPVWVANNSAEVAKAFNKKAGDVVFQVGTGNSIDRVLIPPGSDPVCVSDQVDPESLRTCRDLFKLINSRVLILLDPEKAAEFYAKNDTRRKIVAEKIRKNKLGIKVEQDTPEIVKQTEIPIDNSVIDLCLKLKHKAVTADQALERLEENVGVYSEEDLSYVMNNGKFAVVKDWAKEQLNSES